LPRLKIRKSKDCDNFVLDAWMMTADSEFARDRFSRSTKDVFNFEESSESRSLSSNRHVSPISVLRSTLMMRSFLPGLDHLAVQNGLESSYQQSIAEAPFFLRRLLQESLG
jgi:hypothetical protein